MQRLQQYKNNWRICHVTMSPFSNLTSNHVWLQWKIKAWKKIKTTLINAMLPQVPILDRRNYRKETWNFSEERAQIFLWSSSKVKLTNRRLTCKELFLESNWVNKKMGASFFQAAIPLLDIQKNIFYLVSIVNLKIFTV